MGVVPDGRGPQLTPGIGTTGRVSRYRVDLPKAGILPTGVAGHFEATEHAEERRGWRGRYLEARDLVLGSTLASYRIESEKLNKAKALAVFSSDALSSNAYATQEILFVLILAGSGALAWSLPIALAITVLFGIVVFSYRQTVHAYPNGGGAYIVAHENLGLAPGLIAAASLLIDYVLTVAVSVAAAMDALVSLEHSIRPVAVPLAVVSVLVVMVLNLRGMRESGTIFAIPTYAFIASLGLAIVVGLAKVLIDGENPLSAGEAQEPLEASESLGLFLILKAFANGCSALTGVEAISNGVTAFRAPSSRNAAQALAQLGMISGFLFLGTTILARHNGFIPSEDSTIPSQLGAESFGDGTVLFAFLQIMTAGILILAANTAFNGFPRLAAILARDGYMPRIFHALGNRLVFSYGIFVLTAVTCLLLIGFNAETTALIPLYALGVFLSFTLSQWGLFFHFKRSDDPNRRRSMAISAFGGSMTAIVFLVILEAKFLEGAWVVVILIPALAFMLWLVGRFYGALRRALYVNPGAVLDLTPRGRGTEALVVPVEEINLATVMTLGAACERSRDVTAVHVLVDPDEPSTVEENWDRQFLDIPLVVIDSPFRTVSEPIAVYVNDRLREPPHQVAVMIPVLEVKQWYAKPLVNQSLKRLRALLEGRRHVEVTPYPYNPGLGAGRRRQRGTPGDPS